MQQCMKLSLTNRSIGLILSGLRKQTGKRNTPSRPVINLQTSIKPGSPPQEGTPHNTSFACFDDLVAMARG